MPAPPTRRGGTRHANPRPSACAGPRRIDRLSDARSRGAHTRSPLPPGGATFGFQVNAGLAFLLDIVDRTTAKIARHEVGLYHTYLFAEFVLGVINNFGREGALNLISETFVAGISFEF